MNTSVVARVEQQRSPSTNACYEKGAPLFVSEEFLGSGAQDLSETPRN